MKKSKLQIASIAGATISGLACIIIPIMLLLFGSTAIALVPAWLDFVLVPVFIVLTAISIYYWHRNRKSTES